MISPSVRFVNIMTAPIAINQNNPIKNPDFENTYGRPSIPAPMIVPERVNVVAQNFLLILSPHCLNVVCFYKVYHDNLLKVL